MEPKAEKDLLKGGASLPQQPLRLPIPFTRELKGNLKKGAVTYPGCFLMTTHNVIPFQLIIRLTSVHKYQIKAVNQRREHFH